VMMMPRFTSRSVCERTRTVKSLGAEFASALRDLCKFSKMKWLRHTGITKVVCLKAIPTC